MISCATLKLKMPQKKIFLVREELLHGCENNALRSETVSGKPNKFFAPIEEISSIINIINMKSFSSHEF